MSNTPNEYTAEQRARDEAFVALHQPLTFDEVTRMTSRRDALLAKDDEGIELSRAEQVELTAALDAIDTEYTLQDAKARLAKGGW